MTTNAQPDLPVQERSHSSLADRLAYHEAIIENSHQAARDALYAIYAEKLYLDTHSSFEDYCEQRWGYSRQHGYRLVDAARVAINLSPIGDTTAIPETHLRPLARLEPEMQIRIYEVAQATAPASGMTARHVARTALEVIEPVKNNFIPRGTSVPACLEPGCCNPVWAKQRCSTHQLRRYEDTHVKRRILGDADCDYHTLILIDEYLPYAEIIEEALQFGKHGMGHHAVISFQAEMKTYGLLYDDQSVRFVYRKLGLTYVGLED
jgi:hypothetical protein